MPGLKLVSMMCVVGLLAACGSAERSAARATEDAAEAQEEVSEKRLELVEKYEDCMEEAEGDPAKQSGCEQHLKAAEALQ